MAVLIVSLEVPHSAREALRREATPLLTIDEVQEIALFSAEAHSVIKILADALDWTLPLKAAASVFLTQLAKNAADDLWKNKKEIAKALGSAAVFPIRKLVAAFEKARQITGKPTTVAVGLPLPDKHFGAVIVLPEGSSEGSAVNLAIFVYHAKQIEGVLRKQITAGRKIVGPVQVCAERDGSICLVWMDRDTLLPVEVFLPLEFADKTSAESGDSASA